MLKAIGTKVCALLMGAALLMVPALGWAQYQQATPGTGPPPIEQPLVREGTLAVRLAAALHLGSATSEVEAETLLGQAGIAPRNGWIADYPVTPDIIGELRAALAAAADNNQIAMNRDEALAVLDSIMAQLGVDVNASNVAPPAAEEQNIVPVEEIYNYYYDQGPPIVTYYAPPVDYYYLYSWVPYPFWCDGFWFGGFFVLNDFDRPLFHHHGHHHHDGQFVSNHFRNPATNGFARIDPATRSVTPAFAGIGASAHFMRRSAETTAARLGDGPANRLRTGFTTRPPAPTGAGMNLPTRISPWVHATRTGRFAPEGPAAPSGVMSRNRGFESSGGGPGRLHGNSGKSAPALNTFGRFQGNSPQARSFAHSYSPRTNSFANSRAYSSPARNFDGHVYSPSVNSFPNARTYSPPARSFTARSYSPSPQLNNSGNFRSYSPPAQSFTPRSSFSAPSFHGGFSGAPSFHGGGFSGGRGGRR